MNAESLRSVGRLIAILFFTVICLVIGIQIGVVFNRNIVGVEPGPTPTLTASPLVQPNTEQMNYLVVYVNRLEARRPDLKGVWLIVGVPEEYRYTLLPIFPSTGDNAEEVNKNLANQFGVDEGGTINTEFLNSLRNFNYFWNHIHVVDDIGLIEIYDQLAGYTNLEMVSTGTQRLAAMVNWQQSPENAVAQQHQFFAEICQGVGQIRPEADIVTILELNPEHLLTDVDDQNILYDWGQIIQDPSQFVCEFPSFP